MKLPNPVIFRRVLRFVRDAVLVYLGLIVILYIAQRKLIFPTSHAISRLPSDKPYNMAFDDVMLPAGDADKTNAWFVPADGAAFTILFCRGNGGTLSDWVDVMALFHQMNFNILVFDYGGYGRSTGSPSEKRLYNDARAAWRYLTRDRAIEPKNIVLVGHSIGGGVASQLAVEVASAGLILQSTFTSMAQVCQDHLPFFPVKPFVRDRFDTLSKVPRIACPKLFVHSADDTLITIKHGRALFEAASEPKTFIEITGDHNEGMFASAPVYSQAVMQFVNGLSSE